MHAKINKIIFGKSSQMITSRRTRYHGEIKGGDEKVVNTTTTPKILHGLHSGGRSMQD
jgi:hypothetical protein